MNEHISKHKIIVSKTAEIITNGRFDESTRHVWIVLHGYGQLPEFFIKSFVGLSNTFIIAPSGLSKAYLKGFNGRVGANWMTSHEREEEILDYNNYLNQVIKYFCLEKEKNIQINVLGFSQGAATACRFVNQTNIKLNQLVLWGGLVPNDLMDSSEFLNNNITIVHGTNDEFILPKKQQFVYELDKLSTKGVKNIEYEGTHKVENQIFRELQLKYWT